MNMWYAFFIVLAVFAFGDFIGTITKARISSMFVIMMTFLALFMCKVIPANICETAGLTALGKITMCLLLVNMGTSVDLKQLKQEWRSVAGSCIAMAIAIASCMILIPVIGRPNALVAAPVINGGIVATNVMIGAATDKGLALAAALAAFIYATQKFVGTLPASTFGLKAAKRYVAELRQKKQEDPTYVFSNGGTTPVEGKAPTFAERHAKYYTVFTCLAIGAAITALGSLGSVLTNKWVGQSLWCMILGIACRNLGIVPPNIMKGRANSNGFFMFGSLVTIIPSLAKVDFSMLGELGFAAFAAFAVTLIGIVVVFKVLPVWKVVGDKDLAIGIAMCQMIGYPGTQLISEEIAKAVGETPEEVEYLETKIGTAYVIAGFASVTIVSVFVASFMANIL